MRRFEEEDAEPVAVVRTLADFALALTLIVLMLVGTRSAAESKQGAETRAARMQAGAPKAELTLRLVGEQFAAMSSTGPTSPASALALAQQWSHTHTNTPATIVLQFPSPTLATGLHRALLALQSAFGTNLARIDTVPQP